MVAWHSVLESPNVPAPWTLTAGPLSPGEVSLCGAEAGVAVRAVAASGLAERDWNVVPAVAVVAAVARVDKATGQGLESGPDC